MVQLFLGYERSTLLHNNIFIRLVEAVEAQGGELLAETHYPTPFVYKIPGRHGRVRREDIDGTGCNQEALLNIPYDPEPRSGGVAEQGQVKVCAIDDMVHLWPRFAEAVA